MRNLVEQASNWLQSEACRSGSIVERTNAVVLAFRSYILEEKQEVCNNTGLPLPLIMDKIDTTDKLIRQILSAFLRGNQQDALQKTHKMMQSMKFDKMSPGVPMYKCRENSKLFHFSKDEMFHIPYEKRNLVGNQRFSLSGLPCLYLGGSSYICWEESHDSGNPVDFKDLGTLFMDIIYFVSDFKLSIKKKGNEIITTHSDMPLPHDFVKEKYKDFCFIDEINDTVHKNDGKISFKIETQIGTFINVFGKKGVEVLCKDGYIRNSKEEGIEPLKIWDRDEVIALLDKMYQKVISICDTNGYDTETYSLGISFEAKLQKEGVPSHLFTESEIETLMRNADDEYNNKLVIDEDGYAHIVQNPKQGFLYPVSQETWDAGNMYVGKNSNLSDLHDSYVLCMHLWLAYLETGQYMYDDYYVPDDGLDKIIEKVKKYYLNGRV